MTFARPARARSTFLLVLLLLVSLQSSLGNESVKDGPNTPILLWPEGASGSESWLQLEAESELIDQRIIRNVVQPTLTPFPAPPETNTGAAVIVAPGGGFKFLSIDQEGIFVAQWLNQRGITAFVLKYRLDETAAGEWAFNWQLLKLFGGVALRTTFSGDTDFPEKMLSPVQSLAIDDGLRAIELVRQRAQEWNIRPDTIGILGFSAGGAVANGTAIHGAASNRPDFVASIYGVPVAGEIPENAPPLFQVAAEDDPLVPIRWNQTLHNKWQAAGRSSELIRYAEAGHGYGMRKRGKPSDDWINRFHEWLRIPQHPSR